MFQIKAAQYYEPTDDLWLITCYFNPINYKTKIVNYHAFKEKIQESGLNLLTIECVFGDADFSLDESSNVIRVRSPHIMWQKERLLNIAIEKLPKHVKKIAWLDCDILFSNSNWAIETSDLLDIFPIVQPYTRVFRLPEGLNFYDGEAETWRSFGYVLELSPNLFSKGNFNQHGHSGFVWAARREIIQRHKLYDALISGSADHMMIHAMCGDLNSSCVRRITGTNRALLSHFSEWGELIFQDVRGAIGYTKGSILHLWHGATENRQYIRRHDELIKYDFDPLKDIKIGASGTWEWNSNKTELHQWAIDYFGLRKEDGGN